MTEMLRLCHETAEGHKEYLERQIQHYRTGIERAVEIDEPYLALAHRLQEASHQLNELNQLLTVMRAWIELEIDPKEELVEVADRLECVLLGRRHGKRFDNTFIS